jgi:GAF domain-containing protein
VSAARSKGADKGATYHTLKEQLRSLLDPSPGFVGAMATTAALIRQAFPHYYWVGFYLPGADGSLMIGPYQGPLACLRLPPGKGVCGAAVTARKTIVVPDVHAFAGHIACDPRAMSEIVVPLLHGGRLRAVLDVDSAEPAAFDLIDQVGLEEMAKLVAAIP